MAHRKHDFIKTPQESDWKGVVDYAGELYDAHGAEGVTALIAWFKAHSHIAVTTDSGGVETVTVTVPADVAQFAPVPAVTGLTATPAAGQVTLAWTNPTHEALTSVVISAAVSGTTVDINGDAEGTDLTVTAASGTAGSRVIDGLNANHVYTFKLVAVDGVKPNSAEVTVEATTPA